MDAFRWIAGRIGRVLGPPSTRVSHTTVPAPPDHEWAERLHAQHCAALPTLGPVDLLLVGDSLVQFWPLGLWSPWRAYGLGVGGDRTQHVLWRLDRLAWVGCSPKRILIVAGTNNLLAADGAEDIAAGIGAIAAALRAVQPAAEILVLSPPPLSPVLRAENVGRRALKTKLMRRLPRLGAKPIDADAALIGDGPEPTPKYCEDFIHLTDRGYEVLTERIRAAAGR